MNKILAFLYFLGSFAFLEISFVMYTLSDTRCIFGTINLCWYQKSFPLLLLCFVAGIFLLFRGMQLLFVGINLASFIIRSFFSASLVFLISFVTALLTYVQVTLSDNTLVGRIPFVINLIFLQLFSWVSPITVSQHCTLQYPAVCSNVIALNGYVVIRILVFFILFFILYPFIQRVLHKKA